jgi:DNA-binding SARP family transcriptional activator
VPGDRPGRGAIIADDLSLGEWIEANAPGQRAIDVLAILLLNANQPVATDRLVDQLWGGRPPVGPEDSADLRVEAARVTGDAVSLTRPAGYDLRVRPGELDLHRFQALVAEDGRHHRG